MIDAPAPDHAAVVRDRGRASSLLALAAAVAAVATLGGALTALASAPRTTR